MIDISALLYLVQDNEELKYRLLSLVEFTTEDIEVLFGNFLKNTSDLNTSYLNLRIIKMLLRKKRYIQQRNICMQKH